MSIIDKIICDIEKRVDYSDNWHVEIVNTAKKEKGKQVYSWNTESHLAAKAIKDYLVARGMSDGVLAEPYGSFIRIVKQARNTP
ncbi:MAG: hypothetical protein A2283_22040 [Lentisphaerae bacterium RIFOXYA12_FULL_48_11]|nr:MAG: hypothetical protein A2283_22040 [Lentisphaerae bacterium RIFOXYA12_FULL_48_11]